mmetsp:Transcript_119844/g.374727  ORF Transcript_119844/g.374727 Transcript_119844/m.374727 type:complete len:211 (+) Transcript_119844:45-677(+)
MEYVRRGPSVGGPRERCHRPEQGVLLARPSEEVHSQLRRQLVPHAGAGGRCGAVDGHEGPCSLRLPQGAEDGEAQVALGAELGQAGRVGPAGGHGLQPVGRRVHEVHVEELPQWRQQCAHKVRIVGRTKEEQGWPALGRAGQGQLGSEAAGGRRRSWHRVLSSRLPAARQPEVADDAGLREVVAAVAAVRRIPAHAVSAGQEVPPARRAS